MRRITQHPILPVIPKGEIAFTFNGVPCTAREGEVISSALIANGIDVFGHHPRDAAPQGLYCANGQCAHCMVLADGIPVKACMTAVMRGMEVKSCEGFPSLPADDSLPFMHIIPTVETQALIIGGGPAGVSAALELAAYGVSGILVDDKQRLGGKLTLQTHRFFGSRKECYAGTRGTDIAMHLEEELRSYEDMQVWLNSPAIGVFSGGKVGILRQGSYIFVKPEILLVAAGARERTIAFPGCDMPGVIGAGAFQTLVNRDLVRPSERVFICGGGNVGLITGYHALQAGIDVVGLAEAMPECGGYAVHLYKLKRLGVTVFTSHTVVRADGGNRVESVTIREVDRESRQIPGTEKTFNADTLLIAVGLNPVNELYGKAKEYGMKVLRAGDAEEISEASAAMVNGRIQGRIMAREAGVFCSVPGEWKQLSALFMRPPGKRQTLHLTSVLGTVYPVIRCDQEIPCNPCVDVCPNRAIRMGGDGITALPFFDGECSGCARCVLVCPGLAIVLVDERIDERHPDRSTGLPYNKEKKTARLTLPFEFTFKFTNEVIKTGDVVVTTGFRGDVVGTGRVAGFRASPGGGRRRLMLLDVPFSSRLSVAGVRIRKPEEPAAVLSLQEDDPVVCRCERVRKREIVGMIRSGCRDMNQIKAVLRAGMGACGGRSCTQLILALFKEEGIDPDTVTLPVYRPPEMETPLKLLAGVKE